MLIGDLATFKSYRKKNNLLAKQMDTKFLIKNESPRKTLIGNAGDYIAIDEDGIPAVIRQEDFEKTYEEIG